MERSNTIIKELPTPACSGSPKKPAPADAGVGHREVVWGEELAFHVDFEWQYLPQR